MIESLWQGAARLDWCVGGYDVPGIHSICSHPTRAGEMLVGISCGCAWIPRADGASRALFAVAVHPTKPTLPRPNGPSPKLGLWLQHEVVQSVVDATLNRTPLPPAVAHVFGGFVTASQVMAVVVTLAACALLGWIMRRLMSPTVRQEFA